MCRKETNHQKNSATICHPPTCPLRSVQLISLHFLSTGPPAWNGTAYIKDLKISDSRNVLQTKNKNIFHDIHLERELEWGCIKEVDNGQTKYDCFHLSQIKDPVPNCNFSLEDCKSTIAPCQYLHPVSLERTLRFSAVAVIYGLDILGNPETKYCVCDVRNTALPNQKYCPPWSSFPAGYYALTGIGNAPCDRDSHPLPLWISSTFLRAWESQ